MAVAIWENVKVYKKNDIIEQPLNSDDFYYSLEDHTSIPSTSGTSGTSGSAGVVGSFPFENFRWDGILNINGESLPHFFWKPDFGIEYQIKPVTKIVKFGDGYEQRSKSGFDNVLLKLNLNFSNRNYKEYVAMMHFLRNRKGYRHFVFIPPPPYSTYNYSYPKHWICRKWSNTLVFDENNMLEATFEEVPKNSNFKVIA